MWMLPLHRLPNSHTQICHTWLTEQALKAVGCAFCWLSIRDGHVDEDYADSCGLMRICRFVAEDKIWLRTVGHKNRSNIGQKWAKIGRKSVQNQSKMWCKNEPEMGLFFYYWCGLCGWGLCGCGLCASQKSGAWPSLLSIDYWISSYFYWISIDCLVFLLTSTAFKWLSSVFLRISTYFYCLSTDFIQTFYWLLLTLYWLINNFCWVLLSQQNKANWISIDDSTIFLNKQTKKKNICLSTLATEASSRLFK